MVHSGHHPLTHRPLRIVLGWCTVDIINIVLRKRLDSVDIILLNIVLLG